MKIDEIDKNLAVESKLDIPGIKYRNALDTPFDIYGLYRAKETGKYIRLPENTAEKVSTGVHDLSTHTSGARLRFRTDSPYVAIKAELAERGAMPHMPLSGSHGFDLYVFDGKRDLYQGSFIPPYDSMNSYESVVRFSDARMREITIHFPLYNGVKEFLIGVNENAQTAPGRKYRPIKPVVYYGSSITQGGCASRPGNHYPCAIARETNVDFLCLGFSGSARGEREIAEYLAGIPASVFVCDYDHNAPNNEHLKNTHYNLYQCYRKNNPKTPVILISRPDISLHSEEDIQRRDTIYRTYLAARESGDENVYFIDGFSLFSGKRRQDCTVDGCHPNDLGFFRMAEVIGEYIHHCLSTEEEIQSNDKI